MDVHKNARLSLYCRALLVHRIMKGRSLSQVAQELGVSPKSVTKWVRRYQAEGVEGLKDRSSRPHRLPRATAGELQMAVLALRRHRLTMSTIASQLKLSRSTVARILKRAGLSRLTHLTPALIYPRYERSSSGELLHLDIKKLGRIARMGFRVTGDPRDSVEGGGWEFVHVAIDDHSRVAFAEVMDDEDVPSACAFLRKAVAHYARLGVTIREILTDNGGCYRGRAFAQTCLSLGLKHRFTRPYTPRTNGKAERFIQTALREWAYARAYHRSHQRTHDLPLFLHRYNWHRPHASLAGQPPASRLGFTWNNLLRLHS